MIPLCPCDTAAIAAPTNLPQLPHIAYRVGAYADFRRAVLTPLDGETTLAVDGAPVWRTTGGGDLAVVIAEWFAYIADVLTFYNERIANQDYLRTADLPESVAHLIALLGYRPRPAIGASGVLAALVSPGQSAVLPKGLQFQSKPAPGQAPQIFELAADTPIGLPDQIPAIPPPALLAQAGQAGWLLTGFHSLFGKSARFGYVFSEPALFDIPTYSLRLRGKVDSIQPGALLSLRPRNPASGDPLLATVSATSIAATTSVTFSLEGTPPASLTAAQTALESALQRATAWTLFGGAISGATLHLASLVRQIGPGDWLLLTRAVGSPLLAQVKSTTETIWDATANASTPTTPADPLHPVPIPHTILTMTAPLPGWDGATGVAVRFDWRPVGTLLDQPPRLWTGTPTALLATNGQTFPKLASLPILLQDANGQGVQAVGDSTGGDSTGGASITLGALPDPVAPMQPPFLVLPNLLPVSRGKTVANEMLGSGDATNPAQDFRLSQSPVTYLQQGTAWASTIALRVDGLPWTEIASFFGQTPDARVFVTREDDSGKTHVMFGDGVNGARLPTGRNNVVASYRVGAGAASPAAGKLTVIAQSYPGLRAVLNPVAVGGGADPDPPDQIRRYAPRSVLTFGRAVGVFDYEALAAQAPGVARAKAVWAWNDASQRGLVTVYVGDDSGAHTAAKAILDKAGDPNRPIKVEQAKPIAASLTLTVLTTQGMDLDAITAAIIAVLADPDAGLFGVGRLAIGQPLFDSQIEAAILAVPGAVAITAAQFSPGPGPLHDPGEGGYFTLDPDDIHLTPEPDSNGR